MYHPIDRKFIMIGAACLALFGFMLASGPVYASAAVPAPFPGAQFNQMGKKETLMLGVMGSDSKGGSTESDSTGGSNEMAAFFCTFYANADHVHVSRTAFKASGHGWWTNVTCRATFAVVTVQLQEYYTDGSWRDKGALATKTVKTGGGSNKRANAQTNCNDATRTGWRSIVKAKPVGVFTVSLGATTPPRNIACRQY